MLYPSIPGFKPEASRNERNEAIETRIQAMMEDIQIGLNYPDPLQQIENVAAPVINTTVEYKPQAYTPAVFEKVAPTVPQEFDQAEVARANVEAALREAGVQ